MRKYIKFLFVLLVVTVLSGCTSKLDTAECSFESKQIDITAAFVNDADNVVTILLYETAAADCYIKNPAVQIVYTNDPVYAITFSETNSVAATVKVSSLDVTHGISLPDGTYDFTATAAGYKNYAGSFTVSGAAKNVSFTMIAKETWNYTLNAVYDGTTFGPVASGSALEGANVTAAYPTYINVNGTLYEAARRTYSYVQTCQQAVYHLHKKRIEADSRESV